MRKVAILTGALLALAFVGCTQAPTEEDKKVAETKAAELKAKDVADIKAIFDKAAQSLKAKDVNAIMTNYVADDSLLVFDAMVPRQYKGAAAYRKDFEELINVFAGDIEFTISDVDVNAGAGDIAWATSIQHMSGKMKDGKPMDITVRVTDNFKRTKGQWLIAHEHVSFPVDLATGKADLTSKP